MDVHGDGHKEVLVNTFVHAIELLEPETGQPVANGRFPIFRESKLHGSTAVYVNNDDTKNNNKSNNNNRNNNEKKFIVATYDGEILEFNARGDVDVKVARLPRAKVTKDWFKEKETERERKEKEHLEELRAEGERADARAWRLGAFRVRRAFFERSRERTASGRNFREERGE